MKLTDLIAGFDGVRLDGVSGIDIQGLAIDSRQIQPGWLYVALPGVYLHGLKFVGDAAANGAVAIAVPEGVERPEFDGPVLWLRDARPELARLAARFHGEPSHRLSVIGVTGTNGKTTVTSLIAGICRAAGTPPGLIGTGHWVLGDEIRETTFTTPESPTLQALFAEMIERDIKIAAMEVSSVGLEEDRVEQTRFAAAGFLNLTQDHLDYHPDMTAYRESKWRLFRDLLADDAVAVIDVDDPCGVDFADRLDRRWRLSLEGDTEVHFKELTLGAGGFEGVLQTPRGSLSLKGSMPGRFNASNAAMAAALALLVGLPQDAIEAGIAQTHVRGRMQVVPNDQDITVVVDYAHSADALDRVIETLRPLTQGRLLCIFGCGGDRDPIKRGPMGQVAAKADAVIVTSDNPRGEDPQVIADAAAEGALSAGRTRVAGPEHDGIWVQIDRRQAIQAAIGVARAGDTVLIAGKGHETYQETAGVRRPFDDVAEAQMALGGRV